MKQPENIVKYGIRLQAIRQALSVCLDEGFLIVIGKWMKSTTKQSYALCCLIVGQQMPS